MKNFRVYFIFIVLFLSSMVTSSTIVYFAGAINQNPPPAGGGETKQTWTVDNENVPRQDAGPIWTMDIIIGSNNGRMTWTDETAYVRGNFYVNGSFEATRSTIYFAGTNFDIYGDVNLKNCTLVMNNSFEGDANIFVRNGATLNISNSLVRSNQTVYRYGFTYESGSSGYIENSHIYNVNTSKRGVFVQSSGVEFENTTFKDNYNHIDTLNANPKIKNCTFHGGSHVENNVISIAGSSTDVHVVSSTFNVTECNIEGSSVLYRDYFVIINTINNTKKQGVGGASIDFEDSSSVSVASVQTSSAPGPDLGYAQAVRLTSEYYDVGNFPTGNSGVNPHTITATDPWNEISPKMSIPMNVPTALKNPKQLIFHTFVFNFKPNITSYQSSISVVEKEIKSMDFAYHDRDYSSQNPTEITINFNVSATYSVTYNAQTKKLDFLYSNGAPSYSVVNVSLNDSDGNYAYADIKVYFTAVNDPPAIDIPVADFHVWEGRYKYIDISVSDVDNLANEITVGTNSTQSIKYKVNGTLEILYENDFGPDLKQDTVEVWANDGSGGNNSKTILITFHQTPDAPNIIKTLTIPSIPEDNETVYIDLNDYWQDDDYDADPKPENKPGWYTTKSDIAGLVIKNETFMLEITPIPDAYGTDIVTLYLEDGDGLQDSTTFNLEITPKNDQPYIQNPSFDPTKAEAGDTFTFYVDYFDLENEAPTKISLMIDGVEYPMTASDSGDTDYTNGKKYQVAVQLFTEIHVYKYIINDGSGDVESEPVFTTNWPKIENIARYAEKWSKDGEFMVRILYYSKAGGEITINENPTKPSNSTYPLEYTDIGFFYGVSTTIKNVQWIYMRFDLEKANVTDIFVTMTEVKIYWYDSEDVMWNTSTKESKDDKKIEGMTFINFSADLSSEILFAPLGPIDNDVDNDGVFNDEDAFPFDPNEWEDSDGDGFGDNKADKFPYDPCVSKDSDGDGYPDEWNLGCTGSTVDPDLYLDEFPNDKDCSRDFDDDDLCDEKDDDDDGDGMPDIYEKNYPFLNPYDASDADKDYDGDGATNYEEYEYGSEPDNDKSYPPDIGGDGDGPGSMMTIIAIIIVIILIVVVLLMFFRKPKEKKEALMQPPEGAVTPPPAPAEGYTYEQPPAPEMPAEGIPPAPPSEGEFVVDDTQGESMVPEVGQVETEGGETTEEVPEVPAEASEEDETVSEEEFDEIEE